MAWAVAAAALPVLISAYQQSQEGAPPGEQADGAAAPILAGDETTTTDVRVQSSFTVAGSGGPATSSNLTPETPPLSLLEQLKDLLPTGTAQAAGLAPAGGFSPWLLLAIAGAAAVGLYLVLRKS